MSSRFFGPYLLEKGRITSQQLANALEHQKTFVNPVGVLALEKGLLTAEQVKKLLDHQNKVDRTFGDLAVAMGFLSPSQVDELLQAPASQRIFLAEALVSKGYLTAEVLERELKEYRKDEEKILSEIAAAFGKLLHRDIVTTFTDLLIIMFTRFANQSVKIEQCETGKDKVRWFRWVISQKIAGNDIEFNCLLSVPAKLILQMASTMLDEAISTTDELALDATKEFVNVANGNACVKLSQNGTSFRILPPEVHETTTKPYHFQGQELVCVHLASPDSKLEVAFEF
jgi:CheY-specific phosphatase CheX